MGITGAALVTLGIICIAKPLATVISLAWVIGLVTLISGIATFLNWTNLRRYFPQSGSIFLSSMMQILLGVIFLRHDLALAAILPLMFAFFLIFEGINLAIRSADYRKIGFRLWWVNLVLGLAAAVLGFLSLSTPGVGGMTLSTFVGIGLIVIGSVYFVALSAVNRFERRLQEDPWIDEQ